MTKLLRESNKEGIHLTLSKLKQKCETVFLDTVCHNLLVDEDMAWHHSSAVTVLQNGGFDVRLFEEEYAETKNILLKQS